MTRRDSRLERAMVRWFWGDIMKLPTSNKRHVAHAQARAKARKR